MCGGSQSELHIELLLGFPARSGFLLTVNIEANGLFRVNAQSLFYHLSYPKYRVRLRGVSKPDGQLVPLPPHVDHGAVDLSDTGYTEWL